MRQRLLTCVGLLCLVLVASLPAAAQAYSTPVKPAIHNHAKLWTAPRMPDGHPELQGIWSNASNAPLERPKELGTKEFYTAEEYAALVAKRGFLGDRGGPQEVHYDFSQYGMDAMQSKFAPNLRTSLIIGPEGRIPPMLPEAVKRNVERAANAKAHEFDGPEYRSLTERCIVYGELEGPPMLPPMYNNNMQIVQNPGYVAILNEMYHDNRIIPTDGRPHPLDPDPSWMGNAVARWDGDTLVVDSIGYNDRTEINGYRHTESLHVVERISRPNVETLQYEATIEDPNVFAGPWVVRRTFPLLPEYDSINEFVCENNRDYKPLFGK